MTQLLKEFQEFRKILCICPCCGDLVRVSDLRLRAKGPAPRTWLDKYEKKGLALDKRVEKFEEKKEELRALAREKGRKEAQRAFNKAISPAFKALKYDPFDVKPILNPVDFIVFKGMNEKDYVSEIVMLSKRCRNPPLNTIRKQVKNAITKKNYDWQLAKIDDTGNISFE